MFKPDKHILARVAGKVDKSLWGRFHKDPPNNFFQVRDVRYLSLKKNRNLHSYNKNQSW